MIDLETMTIVRDDEHAAAIYRLMQDIAKEYPKGSDDYDKAVEVIRYLWREVGVYHTGSRTALREAEERFVGVMRKALQKPNDDKPRSHPLTPPQEPVE